MPYATLRDLYSGRSTNPAIGTLDRLANAYGFSSAWFLDASEPEAAHTGGLLFPAKRQHPSGQVHVRMETIPWASWPLPDVYNRFRQYVLSLSEVARQNLIGDVERADPLWLDAKIAEFLLAPYDKAESIERAQTGKRTGRSESAAAAEARARRLRRLGLFWEDSFKRVDRVDQGGTRPKSAPHNGLHGFQGRVGQ